MLMSGADAHRFDPRPSTKPDGDTSLNEIRKPQLGSSSTRFQLAQLGFRTLTTIDRRSPWRSARTLKIESMTAR